MANRVNPHQPGARAILGRGSHAEYAEIVTGLKFKPHVIHRLNQQQDDFNTHWDYVCRNPESCLASQIAHVVLLPFKAVTLVFQIAGDVLLYTAFALLHLITFDQCDDIANEHKARAYNLFVDVVVLASLPVSIFISDAYNKAQSLHLGTFKVIEVTPGPG